jgi:hypothetical protein
VTFYYCRILVQSGSLRQIFERYSNVQFHEKLFHADGRTDRDGVVVLRMRPERGAGTTRRIPTVNVIPVADSFNCEVLWNVLPCTLITHSEDGGISYSETYVLLYQTSERQISENCNFKI